MDSSFSKRLRSYEKERLGLECDGIVRLVNHNSRWKRLFSDEAYMICHKLNIDSLRLYHCGSTAVEGIVSKPIIDIVGAVSDLAELDKKKNILKEIGYEYMGEYGIEGRRYSVLFNPDKTKSYFHLHIFKDGSKFLEDHLKFRDILRNFPKAALKYEERKKSLTVSRSEYPAAKSPVIHQIIDEYSHKLEQLNKSKYLLILGSSRGHKNTLDYARSIYSDKELEVIELANSDISAFSYDNKNQSDDFLNIIRKMIAADRIIIASPVYWYAVSGHVKNFIDRFSDLLDEPNKHLGDKLYGKKVDFLSTGSDEELPNGFTVFLNLTSIYFRMDFIKTYYKCIR